MQHETLLSVRAIFDEVFDLSNEERQQYLAAHHAHDVALCNAVERLFAHEAAVVTFLEAPALATWDKMFTTTVPGSHIGSYRIECELGRGGMGVVYLAVRDDDVFRKQVAIKLVWPGLSAMADRFRQERQMLADLEHPHIARLLDGGVTAEGWHYLVMEYVEGCALNDYCQQQKLSVPERLHLFLDVCAAVQHAHQHLIIHRDLKPSNIWVTPEGQVKLLDFGIAKALDAQAYRSDLSLPGTHLMTPEYASPEQLLGEPVTTASDIYSLGVVLFELLTGQRPFQFSSRHPHEIARIVSQQEPPLMSAAAQKRMRDEGGGMNQKGGRPKDMQLRRKNSSLIPHPSSLRGDLDNIVVRALQPEPNHRYASVAQFSEDIRCHLNGEVVQARKPTFAYSANRFVRRHKVAFSAGTAAFVVLLLWMTFLLRQVQVERAQAREQRRQLYAAEVKQALEAWKNEDLVQMNKTLERWQPQAGEEDLRGFEYGYLQRLINASSRTLKFPEVATCDWIPGTNQILVMLANQVAKTFDATTGQEHLSFSGREAKWIENQYYYAAPHFLRLYDHRKIVFYDVLTGAQKLELDYPQGDIQSFFLIYGGDRSPQIFSSDGKGTIKIRDASTGAILREFPGRGKVPYRFFPSPDSEKLLMMTDDHVVRVEFVNQHRPPLEFTEPKGIHQVVFDATSRYLIILTDSALTLRDVATGRIVARHAQEADRIVIFGRSPASNLLFTGSADGTIGLWTVFPLKRHTILKGHTREVTGFGLDVPYLHSTSLDRTVRLWDLQTKQEIAVLRGHTGDIVRHGLNPETTKFITTSQDRTLRIWDWHEVRKPERLTGHTDQIYTVAYSPDGKHIASGGSDHTVIIHDANTGAQRVLRGHEKLVYTVRFSPDSKWLASCADDGTVKLWEVATGRELKTFRNGQPKYWESVRSLAFLPDGQTLLLGNNDGTTQLWDINANQVKAKFKAHTREILSLSLSPDGMLLASGGWDDGFKLWDTTTWQEKAAINAHQGKVWSAVFSPDGKQLATGSGDQTIKLWDVTTMKLLRTLEGHNDGIFQVAFTPDGKRLASVSDDHTVKLWNPNTGQELLTLREHANEVWGVAFSPDGRTMLTGSWDKTLRLWRTAVQYGQR